LTIGPSDGDGGEISCLTVCTAKWLMKACEKDGFVWGRHHLIVPEYNLETITALRSSWSDLLETRAKK